MNNEHPNQKEISRAYFKSDAHMYAFILNHMDGSSRNTMLGLTMRHYESLNTAKTWYDTIQNSLLDFNDVEMSGEIKKALLKLTSLYHRIIGGMIEDNEDYMED